MKENLTGIHGAFFGIAHSRDCFCLVADVKLARPKRIFAVRDWSAAAAIALLASDGAAVGEPEAALAVRARDLASLVGDGAPASFGFNARGFGWDWTVPWRQIAVDRVARARIVHSAVAQRERGEGEAAQHRESLLCVRWQSRSVKSGSAFVCRERERGGGGRER